MNADEEEMAIIARMTVALGVETIVAIVNGTRSTNAKYL